MRLSCSGALRLPPGAAGAVARSSSCWPISASHRPTRYLSSRRRGWVWPCRQGRAELCRPQRMARWRACRDGSGYQTGSERRQIRCFSRQCPHARGSRGDQGRAGRARVATYDQQLLDERISPAPLMDQQRPLTRSAGRSRRGRGPWLRGRFGSPRRRRFATITAITNFRDIDMKRVAGIVCTHSASAPALPPLNFTLAPRNADRNRGCLFARIADRDRDQPRFVRSDERADLAVLAVDPPSKRDVGAILGDKTRDGRAGTRPNSLLGHPRPAAAGVASHAAHGR